MSLTLNLHYLTRQLKFVFLFVIWSYCFLRISHNTLSTAWVSLTEGFFHPDGLTKWWFYITMMPGWWITLINYFSNTHNTLKYSTSSL